MKKMQFMKTLVGRCIAVILLAAAVGNVVPKVPGNQPGAECSVCSDDDIGGGVDDDPTNPTTPLS